MGNEYVSTKLLVTVKNQLDEAKNGKALSEYILDMLTFFKTTGAKPEDFKTHPTIELMAAIKNLRNEQVKDTERIIGIIRGIEKKRLAHEPVPQSPLNNDMDKDVTMAITEVTRLNEELEVQLSQAHNSINVLQAELLQLKNSSVDVDKRRLGEIKDWIKTNIKKDGEADTFTISLPIYMALLDKLNI
ncbi:hypothetical protein LX64_05159 [Chitinophaga skermanii]|uniref:Uncharacterized protein n=1 Tax=Chitinophaga skermanii TaxID=331697 RepID=A0A327PZG4_9BACT|nr:BfmA/BtgA family mobilization protein [Chitinophaga skermanii]RAI97014.1 hypothetical protein LX64_05159 [Chitinophaga skermanii]